MNEQKEKAVISSNDFELFYESISERIASSLRIPLRADGMPDLNNWQEYIKQFNYENLGELISIKDTYPTETHQGILLSKAISYRKNEIAADFVNTLCKEGLTSNQAISILELAKNGIMESKFIYP